MKVYFCCEDRRSEYLHRTADEVTSKVMAPLGLQAAAPCVTPTSEPNDSAAARCPSHDQPQRAPASCCHFAPDISSEIEAVFGTGKGNGEYFCPMCPGVVSSEPGACPQCGMALQRRHPIDTAVDDDPELANMTRRLKWAIVLGLPVFVLAMGPMIGLPCRHCSVQYQSSVRCQLACHVLQQSLIMWPAGGTPRPEDRVTGPLNMSIVHTCLHSNLTES